jgi:hypothetical protein
MTNELDEDAFRRTVQKMTGQDTGGSAPARGRYAFDDPQRFERWAAQRAEAAKADAEKAKSSERKPQATDWDANERWFEDKMTAFIGPAFEQIDKLVGEQLDQIADQFGKERAARQKLEDRVRELMLEQAKAATTIGKLEVAIAHLELRLANGDRRGGGVIDASPSLKSIN